MICDIPIGNQSPKIINAIIEIPKGTHNKYEYNETLGIITLDRVLYSPMHYPVDYGFIPKTRSGDGDHLDVMVINNSPVFSGCLVKVRPIGALLMKDKGIDEKILAVPISDPNFEKITSLKHVSRHFLMEIEHFFKEYKRLENKKVKVEEWVNRPQTHKIIRACARTYQKEQLHKKH